MKKKLIIITVIAIAMVGIFIYFLTPRVIFKDTTLVNIVKVAHYLENGECEDISEKVNLDLLAETIANYKCSKIPKSFAPYQLKDVTYEINGLYNHKPIHILLGDINVVYESGDKGGFQIKDSNDLLTEIELLVIP